jgi:hypothetical protein
MVGYLHGMITPFVDLASTFGYNEAVKNKQPISAQAYADALFHARTHVLRLRTVFASGDLGEYRNVPPLMSLFSISSDADGTKIETTPIKHEPPRRPQLVVTPDATTPNRLANRASTSPNDALSAAQLTELKTKGLVDFKGRGKPPVANDIWVDNPKTKKKAMLCSNFFTIGYYCRFGKACAFFHFRTLRDLPEGPRAAYKAFVEQETTLSFRNARDGQ